MDRSHCLHPVGTTRSPQGRRAQIFSFLHYLHIMLLMLIFFASLIFFVSLTFSHLQAVTKAKLGYDPLEVNPEDMVRFAMEQPQTMASYSVSDAVATYYLYMTYVHPFIFSLATIIPMSPDEVLRKGSGTLCEMLLMVQAFKANVICPNKHQADLEKFYNNRLLESETYIGGHVECLETGVFRSDLPTKFQLEPSAYEQLIGNLDRDLQYAISVEGKLDIGSVTNYDEVKDAINQKLVSLRDHPIREERPLIYHLDVAAMYPNIILTNRLQPPSIVTDVDCTACDFNRPGKNCLRKLEWVWRGETYMAKKNDYYHIKRQIESELIQSGGIASSKPFLDLSKPEHLLKLKDRLKKYCQKAHKRVVDKPITEVREAGICMRENSFYVDTVRSFRDRRYEYKGLNKTWKGKLAEAKASGNSMKIQEAQVQ
jgi:DNA polymerase epsilon subunit 1